MIQRLFYFTLLVAVTVFGVTVLKVPDARSQESPGMKVGTVDLLTVFQGYNRVKDQQVRLQAEYQKLTAQLQQKQKSLQDRVKTIGKLDAIKRRLEEKSIQESIFELDFESKWSQRSAALDSNQLTWGIYAEVLEEIDRTAKANGYDYVLKAESGEFKVNPEVDAMKVIGIRQLLYHNREHDLTQKVLRGLNQKYARKNR